MEIGIFALLAVIVLNLAVYVVSYKEIRKKK